jgi:hypothetical protein
MTAFFGISQHFPLGQVVITRGAMAAQLPH